MDYNAIAKQFGATESTSPSGKKVDYFALVKQFGATDTSVAQTSPETAQNGDLSAGNFVKGLVSAPATMIARPFQAVQSAVQLAGMDISGNEAKAKALNDEALRLALSLRTTPEADKPAIRARVQEIQNQVSEISNKLSEGTNWQPYSNSVIAEAPKTYRDVKKDVGRGVQTVALGMGSPLSAGAAFGFGSSLEQGNDVFSMNTLTSTLLGMGLGKAIDLVGKPLFNAAGKVIGTITPKVLKDIADKGSGAVSNFMKQHELLGGIAKPLSQKIKSGAETFDKKINQTASSLWKGAKSSISNQYPTAGKDIAKYYEKTEMDKLMKPVTEPGSTFNKASEVEKQAKARGIDVKKVAADNKIYISDHISDGKYNTADVAEALSDDAVSGGATVFRPALAEAENGVQRIPISEVRQKIVNKISNIPDKVLSPEQKLSFVKKVTKEYSDASVTAARYRDGYSLTNLYDSKLQTSSGLYKTPKGGGAQSISDTLTAQQKKIESDVFKDLLIKNAPKELKIDAYFKAQEGKFTLANYLKTLDGKKAIQSLFQRGVRKTSQLSGATLGAQTAGPFGMFSGYQFGGIMADTFSQASNPVKVSFLKSIGKTAPEIYGIMRQYVTEQEAARLMRPLLPSGSKFDAALQKVKNEWGAIEMGAPYTPANTFGNDFTQNQMILNNTKQLPAPGQRTILPNTQGTPNPVIAPYGPGGNQGEVGGIRQRRIFRG